jgi:hypothetical protein
MEEKQEYNMNFHVIVTAIMFRYSGGSIQDYHNRSLQLSIIIFLTGFQSVYLFLLFQFPIL